MVDRDSQQSLDGWTYWLERELPDLCGLELGVVSRES